MAKYGFSNPGDIYSVLNSIAVLAANGDWNGATERAANIRDEARHQMSANSNKSTWKDFLTHANELMLATMAREPEDCSDALKELRGRLADIAGPPIRIEDRPAVL